MIRKLRQVLAVTVLLLFSWENVVLAVSDVNPEKFSAYDQVSSLRGPGNIFSWILEENENEEHGDHKAHGTGAEMLRCIKPPYFPTMLSNRNVLGVMAFDQNKTFGK